MKRTRRQFIGAIGATATLTSVSGCMSDSTTGNFRLKDIGLIKRHNGVAAFIEAKNISNEARDLEGYLAVYDIDGVRVSDWEFVITGRDSEVQPGNTVRLYSVYQSRDAGWMDSSNLGQVVDGFTSKFRLHSAENGEPKGQPFSEDNIGEVLDMK